MRKFKVFDFVWAKLSGHPYWPAIVMDPDEKAPTRPKSYNGEMYWVLFFGSHEFAWVAECQVKDYRSHKDFFAAKIKGVKFTYSIMEIEKHIEKAKNDRNYSSKFKLTMKPKVKRKSKTPAPNSGEKEKDLKISENVPVTEICYGVLGTGTIGSNLVNSLIKVGKKVYIWNRTSKKCEKLVEEIDHLYQSNLKICLSPRLVMQHSHIIFNCVSDSQSSKTIIQRTLGEPFSANFMQGKGLVDMSGVDPYTSKELSKLVIDSGGKYLEVRIQHGKVEGIGGGYLFLVSGCKDLFMKCENCFYSLGGTPFPVDTEVGNVTMVNLILQLIKSVCLVGLTEGFSLLERFIPPDSLNELRPIILSTFPRCDYLINKADMILNKNFKLVEQSLQNMARDIRMGMELSQIYSQPMPLCSLADQIFKHCIKLGYGEKDPSAVFMRVRH